jgi:cation diffusion facilitator family transporter
MRPSLTKFAWLSVGTAVLTISIKLAAYLLTGSVGLLSDALEGIVNLVAAVVVLITLKVVEKPPDDIHEYGHDKAEYFSSGIEGTLIVIAALSILFTSVQRLLNPQPLERIGLGLMLALSASVLNFLAGQLLIRTGKKHDSITLEADGKHLLSDVWTSVGVVVGVSIAVLTGLEWVDPVVAILVGLKIGWEGVKIFQRSTSGLMDAAIDPDERKLIENILNRYCQNGIEWHALRTRQSAARRFVSVHILAPGGWTIQQGHDLVEQLEDEIRSQINYCSVFTHVEPIEDPRALSDLDLDRETPD